MVANVSLMLVPPSLFGAVRGRSPALTALHSLSKSLFPIMEPRQADVPIPLQSSKWGAAAPGPRSDPQPRDYVLWSAFNMLLWGGLGCLGFPGLVYSIKARDCKSVGDLEGARRHSDRARVVNIVCSVVVAVVWVIFIIITVIFYSTLRAT